MTLNKVKSLFVALSLALGSLTLFSGFIYESQSFEAFSDPWKIANPQIPPLEEIVENNKGHSVLVAIMDSGVDYNHPALKKNMHYNLAETIPFLKNGSQGDDEDGNGVKDDFLGYDFSGGDGFPSYRLYSKANGKRDLKSEIKNSTSHGTHVAGIVTHGDDSIGILPYRVLPFSVDGLKDSEGRYTSTTEGIIELLATTLLKSIQLAKFQGARVANMSLGVNSSDELPGPMMSRAFKKLEKYMKKAAPNMVFAIAAGNESLDISTGNKIYPCQAHSGNVICVGALGQNEAGEWGIAGFSNVGLQYVDIFAPGQDILSTVPTDHVRTGQKPFKEMSGTPMASPMIAGVAARVIQRAPCLSGRQVVELLKKTANKAVVGVRLGNSNTEKYSIRVVNPKAALHAAENVSCN